MVFVDAVEKRLLSFALLYIFMVRKYIYQPYFILMWNILIYQYVQWNPKRNTFYIKLEMSS